MHLRSLALFVTSCYANRKGHEVHKGPQRAQILKLTKDSNLLNPFWFAFEIYSGYKIVIDIFLLIHFVNFLIRLYLDVVIHDKNT